MYTDTYLTQFCRRYIAAIVDSKILVENIRPVQSKSSNLANFARDIFLRGFLVQLQILYYRVLAVFQTHARRPLFDPLQFVH